MDEGRYSAVPFSLVGFFITDKSSEESIRQDVTPEEMEKLQELMAKLLFTEGVRVVIYPSIVPPDQASDAIKDFENLIFGEGED